MILRKTITDSPLPTDSKMFWNEFRNRNELCRFTGDVIAYPHEPDKWYREYIDSSDTYHYEEDSDGISKNTDKD